jgi:hypothetical protein
MKRKSPSQLSSQSINCVIICFFALPKSWKIPTPYGTFLVNGKLTVILPNGSSSFRNKTSIFQLPKGRKHSFSPNSSWRSPQTLQVHLSTWIFSMNTLDNPWYGDLLIYLRTQNYGSHLSREDRRCICHQAPCYLLVGDILYRCGVGTILRRCLTINEVDKVLNDCHSSTCSGHLSGMSTIQKIIPSKYL